MVLKSGREDLLGREWVTNKKESLRPSVCLPVHLSALSFTVECRHA